METIAIILSLLGTSGLLLYMSSQFKTSQDGGSKYGSVMKILFNAISFVVLLLVPAAGLAIADSTTIDELSSIMGLSMVPVVFLFVIFVFYLVWQYFSDLVKLMTGKTSEMGGDEFR